MKYGLCDVWCVVYDVPHLVIFRPFEGHSTIYPRWYSCVNFILQGLLEAWCFQWIIIPPPSAKQKFRLIITRLLRRLQAQTLPGEAPPIGKIHPFGRIAVSFEPEMRFGCPLGFRISLQIVTYYILWLMTHYLQPLGRGSAVNIFFTNHDIIN